MTIDELYEKYIQANTRATKEWDEYVATVEYKTLGFDGYKGFFMDYDAFGAELVQTLMNEFKLTPAQAGYIYGEAYERYHSGFSDIFYGAADLARFCLNFPK